MTVHEASWGATREWYTPPDLFERLGLTFDLDVASPMAGPVPWVPAARHYSPRENGLMQPWEGRVWCNPPYGPPGMAFVQRMVAHNHGVLLVPARTETRWFQHAASHAATVAFLRDRIHFIREDGHQARASFASVLMGFGPECGEAVRAADFGWTLTSKGSEVSAQPGADRSAVHPPVRLASISEPEHNTDAGIGCWCGPTRHPLDPEIIVHRTPVVA